MPSLLVLFLSFSVVCRSLHGLCTILYRGSELVNQAEYSVQNRDYTRLALLLIVSKHAWNAARMLAFSNPLSEGSLTAQTSCWTRIGSGERSATRLSRVEIPMCARKVTRSSSSRVGTAGKIESRKAARSTRRSGVEAESVDEEAEEKEEEEGDGIAALLAMLFRLFARGAGPAACRLVGGVVDPPSPSDSSISWLCSSLRVSTRQSLAESRCAVTKTPHRPCLLEA